MNLVKWIVLSALGISKDVSDWATTYVEATSKLVKLTVGLTLIPGILGIIIGYAGAETVGQTFITSAGALGALLLSYFYFRAVVIIEALAGLSHVGRGISEKVPELTKKQADDFLVWLRGYTAWAMLVALYGALVPLYKHPTTTLIVVIAVAALAAILGANWTKSESFQKWTARSTVLVLIICTVFLAFPRFSENVRNRVDGKLNSALSWSDENGKIDAESLKIAQNKAAVNLEILQKLRDDKDLLEQRVSACGGDFCNDQEKEKYIETLRMIKEAKDGEYIERRAGVEKDGFLNKLNIQVTNWLEPNSSSQTSTSTPTASPPPPPEISPKTSTSQSKKSGNSYADILADFEADLK